MSVSVTDCRALHFYRDLLLYHCCFRNLQLRQLVRVFKCQLVKLSSLFCQQFKQRVSLICLLLKQLFKVCNLTALLNNMLVLTRAKRSQIFESQTVHLLQNKVPVFQSQDISLHPFAQQLVVCRDLVNQVLLRQNFSLVLFTLS